MVTKSKKNDVILLCGIPATGKSTYCSWLEDEKGFMHLDVEKKPSESKALWVSKFFHIFSPPYSDSISSFVQQLKGIGKPIAIDWGFPPEWLSIVRLLKKQGVQVWWFDGDRKAARRVFSRRGTGSLKDFDTQMLKIETNWTKIEAIIGSNLIHVLDSRSSYTSPELIFERMFRIRTL